MSERLRRAAHRAARGESTGERLQRDDDDGVLAFQLPPPKPEHTSRGIGKGIDEEEGGDILLNIINYACSQLYLQKKTL